MPTKKNMFQTALGTSLLKQESQSKIPRQKWNKSEKKMKETEPDSNLTQARTWLMQQVINQSIFIAYT